MRIFIFLFVALWLAVPANAHEFWLSPTRYNVPSGNPLIVHIRVGQDFNGPAYSYMPRNFTRFDIVSGNQIQAVQSRMGDRPALNQSAPAGLAVIVHETTDLTVTYSDWDVFQSFAEHKDAPEALAQHKARGLPETGFRETYRRFAKSLTAMGHGRGADKPQGLEIEIIALANPYADALTSLPVQVLYQGKPRAHAQLEVFAKAPDDKVTISRLKTDGAGQVDVPLAPGTEYLLDSVVLRALPNDDPAAGPVWHSLWASMTFKAPAR